MFNDPSPTHPGRLALEDGTVFRGRSFGACSTPRTVAGEVVFNTAMTGYQEAITDPSYAGQILTMTMPMIGNCGVNTEDVESDRPQIAGFIVRELSRIRSNHRSHQELGEWLAGGDILAIEGIDTRALVRHLRIKGSMRGVISCDCRASDEELVRLARSSPEMTGRNLVKDVSPDEPFDWQEDLGAWRVSAGALHQGDHPWRVLALDCGAKRNIYRNLTDRGCTVRVVPHDWSAAEIRESRPNGLFVSNGPGDPDAVQNTIDVLREVVREIPTFGICLGHQLLALALGARTFKLPFGHRGANQPVRNGLTGRVEITSQNHGFCVDQASLSGMDCELSHLHLNDGTVAGFRHLTKPIFSVQYHPEASPGPHDSAYLFDCFLEMMRTGRPLEAETMRTLQAGAGFLEPIEDKAPIGESATSEGTI